jgi:hypothetical protein
MLMKRKRKNEDGKRHGKRVKEYGTETERRKEKEIERKER